MPLRQPNMAEERGSARGRPLVELIGVSVSLPRARVDAHEPSGLLSGELGSRWVLCGAMSEACVASGLLSSAGSWARPSAPRHGGVLTQGPGHGGHGRACSEPRQAGSLHGHLEQRLCVALRRHI